MTLHNQDMCIVGDIAEAGIVEADIVVEGTEEGDTEEQLAFYHSHPLLSI
jgi:hypothetical protein